MATIDMHSFSGEKVGSVELDDSVFGAEVKEHLLWEVVKMQRACQRAGTHSTLRRDEVRGGGKKPYRQKGTGRARQGSSRAPQFVGGGKVFTPKPRDYSYRLPRKARMAALRAVLTLRAQEKRLIVVSDMTLAAPKTKVVAKNLQALGSPQALVVDGAENVNLSRSVRNMPASQYLATEGLNVYDVLKYPYLVLSEGSVKRLVERLKADAKGA